MADLLPALDLDKLLDRALAVLPSLGAALLVLVIFYLLFRVSGRPLELLLTRAGLHNKLVELLVRGIYRWTLLVVALVMAAAQVGINVAAAVAGLGVAGIAIGFAAQDVLANVIAGFVVFLDKPFIVGDWITVNDSYGRVADITLRSTRIRTPRNSYVVIPNQQIINAVLENHSKQGELRVDVELGIAYKEDVHAAREVLLAAVAKVNDVRSEPPPRIVVTGLGDSSVNLKMLLWIHDPATQQRVTFEALEAAKSALDQAGIQIPFPHLQLFVDQVEEGVWKRLDELRGDGRPAEA